MCWNAILYYIRMLNIAMMSLNLYYSSNYIYEYHYINNTLFLVTNDLMEIYHYNSYDKQAYIRSLYDNTQLINIS